MELDMNIYSRKTWINDELSPSTAFICAYDGRVEYGDSNYRHTYLKIGDCNKIVHLHKADYDSDSDFIKKLELLSNEITEFIKHLRANYEQ